MGIRLLGERLAVGRLVDERLVGFGVVVGQRRGGAPSRDGEYLSADELAAFAVDLGLVDTSSSGTDTTSTDTSAGG